MPTNLGARVALVHDWLTGLRGGEKVLEMLCEMFPQADLFTLFHEPGSCGPTIESRRVTTSFLDRLPFARRHYRYFLPLFPLAIERLDLTGYDLVISTSHCAAKGVIVPPDARHVCYCLTPMRYAWDKSSDYFPAGWKAAAAAPFLHYLRLWDVTSSLRVDRFIAISQWVRGRIEKYYRRDAEVVYPGVDVEFYHPSVPARARGDYYLAASAFAPYKRLDLAIEACARLGRRLVVAGDGQMAASLARLAGSGIELTGRVSDEKLRDLYRHARAYLFPGEEDYGIQPIEAMACGTPVIALGRGGATETVKDGESGMFFSSQTPDSLAGAILRFEERERSGGWSMDACRSRAVTFGKASFRQEFARALERALGESSRESRTREVAPPPFPA